MTRNIQFATDEYYHVLNKGVEERNIFVNKEDYERFLEGLEKFNTSLPITIRQTRSTEGNPLQTCRGLPSVNSADSANSAKLVEIICFCLLPNHFHLLLKQLVDKGISLFMEKLGTGYASYFNIKHQRKGRLFQGSFKAVHINKESQFLHITRYAHLNVLDLYMPEWREGKIKDWEKAKKFLEEYPWSSYPIYVGKKRSSFCNAGFFKGIFKTSEEYEAFLREWSERSLNEISKIVLE